MVLVLFSWLKVHANHGDDCSPLKVSLSTKETKWRNSLLALVMFVNDLSKSVAELISAQCCISNRNQICTANQIPGLYLKFNNGSKTGHNLRIIADIGQIFANN